MYIYIYIYSIYCICIMYVLYTYLLHMYNCYTMCMTMVPSPRKAFSTVPAGAPTSAQLVKAWGRTGLDGSQYW